MKDLSVSIFHRGITLGVKRLAPRIIRGLYSEKVLGRPGSEEEKQEFSLIDLMANRREIFRGAS